MIVKTCSKCGNTAEATTFHGRRCKECRSKYRKEWRVRSQEWIKNYRATHPHTRRDIERATEWNKNNPAKHRQHCLEYYYRLQDETIMAYGGYICHCCGETEPLFLAVDHAGNDGAEHRKKIGMFHHGAKFYKWLKDRNYPPGFQILCFNCNQGKHRNHGICPHQQP